MRFTKSLDGEERCSVTIIERFTKWEIKKIKEYLKRREEKYDDKSVRQFIQSHTEIDLPEDIYTEE